MVFIRQLISTIIINENETKMKVMQSSNNLPIAYSPDTTSAYLHLTSNLQQTKNEATNVVINIIVASY